MAGTGAGQGPRSMAPTGFNFTTAGTGAMGAGGFSAFTNQNLNGNPFGAGAFSWNNEVDGFTWSRQPVENPVAIAFIGDNLTGKYLSSTIGNTALPAGSPVSMDEALQKIIREKMSKPNGIAELKVLLNEKQMYGNPQSAANSIAQGNGPDPLFNGALMNALIYATVANTALAATQTGTPKILSFDAFLANASPSGTYNNSAFGTGGPKKRVVHQKFKPEEFEIAIDQLFQQTVGRGASEEELNDFVSKLQNYADKNPQVTVSNTSGGTTTETQSGGVDGNTMQKMMRDSALAKPEAEQYNKATTYIDFFREALASPVRLGE